MSTPRMRSFALEKYHFRAFPPQYLFRASGTTCRYHDGAATHRFSLLRSSGSSSCFALPAFLNAACTTSFQISALRSAVIFALGIFALGSAGRACEAGAGASVALASSWATGAGAGSLSGAAGVGAACTGGLGSNGTAPTSAACWLSGFGLPTPAAACVSFTSRCRHPPPPAAHLSAVSSWGTSSDSLCHMNTPLWTTGQHSAQKFSLHWTHVVVASSTSAHAV